MSNREPDLKNIAEAWHVRITEAASEQHRREFGYDHTSVDQWMIRGPYHPAWSWWYIVLVSLADAPGVPPAKKQYPEAEYEVGFWSLDGEPNIEALEAGDAEHYGFKFLDPADLIFHFDGLTRQQAKTLLEDAVRHIVGGASCDSDYRRSWQQWFRDEVEDRLGRKVR